METKQESQENDKKSTEEPIMEEDTGVTSHKQQASRKSFSKSVAVPFIPNMRAPSVKPLTTTSRESQKSDLLLPSDTSIPPLPNTNQELAGEATTSMISAQVTHPHNVAGSVKYDVYAAPFVPSILRAINRQSGNVIVTRTRHKIDNQAYIGSFVGTTFIPTRILTPPNQANPFSSPTEFILSGNTYLSFFQKLWKIECAAKERENEDLALYQVPLQPFEAADGQSLFALSIPGLREDMPLIEMGDTLQLRRLWVDSTGTIRDVTHPYDQDNPYAISQFWNGIRYDASVCGVNRVREMVFLSIDGFTNYYLGAYQIPPTVNVVFPLNKRALLAQHNALLYVNLELWKCVHRLQTFNPAFGIDEGLIKNGASRTQGNRAEDEDEQSTGNIQQIGSATNDWIRRMLFPEQTDGLLQTKLRRVPHRQLFDHVINYEQAHAVMSICENDYGTLPYLISGPPGTGKTKTLVEVAMQLLNTTSTAHILICAPSEAAADTIALRLRQYLNPTQLLRLNGPGRAALEVPTQLMLYSYLERDMFYLPPFKKLMGFNVVVTSCRDAALLADAHVTNSDLWEIEKSIVSAFHPEADNPIPTPHWGALLIDEAAQATELDLLPAISVVCPPSLYPRDLPQPPLVMAGDENQLGPRTVSQGTQLSTSLFARLFSRPLYKDHPLSRSKAKPSTSPPVLKSSMLPILYPPFTNLIRNYRSHPSILSVPSTLFYNDTLLPEAPILPSPLQTSSLWRGRKWPLLFIPHIGADEIERDAGGWYNVSEAKIACDTAQYIIIESKIPQSDICIMSPFAAQVKLLRSMIRSKEYGGGSGLWDVNIGPLEAFQGLESRVVIICTTRTRERFLELDRRRGFGIVYQKRKMNVALTRAKEALVVIGNPAMLGKDFYWREWLGFVWRNKLVFDQMGLWKGDEEGFSRGKIGVLERALVAKDEQGRKKTSKGVLGAGTGTLDFADEEYEAWVESLRAALDEEAETDEEQEEENEEKEEDDERQEDSLDWNILTELGLE